MVRLLVVCLTLAFATIGAEAEAACREDRIELRGDWGTARFRIAVADTVPERAQGLMNVEEMPRMVGMLFVYDRPQRVSFWMENTLIPLDMVFIGADGVVRHVHENAIPMDRTPIFGGSNDIQYVLEINGGLSSEFGIAPGTEVRHPSIEEDQASWPCEAE